MASGITEFSILNGPSARYECTYGRGCDGICCREGRPIIYPDEVELIQCALPRILMKLRDKAREAVRRSGFLTRRKRFGQPVVRNAGGWCIFFNDGCVLQALGMEEGAKFRYKPAVCSLFPIQQDAQDRWYVRQWNFKGEKWNLFCLDPSRTGRLAVDTLAEEIALAKRFHEEAHNSLPANDH